MPPVPPIADSPAGAPPFFLEVFCGKGDLTRACRCQGIPACAIGYYNAVFSDEVPFISLDLTLAWTRTRVLSLIKCKQTTTMLWITPPCGTLSFARERRIAKKLRDLGVPDPKPLRSRRGLTGLPAAMQDPLSSSKIRRANSLVDYTFEIVLAAAALGLPWFISNSVGSYLWLYPQWRSLKWSDVDLETCAFGSERKVKHRIRCSNN